MGTVKVRQHRSLCRSLLYRPGTRWVRLRLDNTGHYIGLLLYRPGTEGVQLRLDNTGHDIGLYYIDLGHGGYG